MPSNENQNDSGKSKSETRSTTESGKDENSSDNEASLIPVVGIAASAGGLKAFKSLLENLSTEIGAAYVLIQHLDPKHESMLVELLSKTSRLPVQEIEDGIVIQPDHVYVAPPNRQVLLYKQFLHLNPESIGPERYRPADSFFQSLADDRGSQSIGVVLSGTASDGTNGCFSIKSAGGTTFAQDEESAEYTGMPANAVASGSIDFVMSPMQIASELPRVVSHPAFRLPALHTQDDEQLAITQDEMHKILVRLRSRTGHDFSNYKTTTLKRRIAKRMLVQRINDTATYIKFLQRNADEVDALFQEVLINVTDFFRDPEVYEELRQILAKRMESNQPTDQPFRIWVPACAAGQEAYSLAMLMREVLNDAAEKRTVPVQIFATDIDDCAIEKARSGSYTEYELQSLSPARRERFFKKVAGGYQVTKSIRDLCVFAVQNIVRDPPFSNLDLVSCRNVLIYLNGTAQKQVLRTLHYALQPTGLLMLGSSETIGAQADLFSTVSKAHKIYQKKAASSRLIASHMPVSTKTSISNSSAEPEPQFDLDHTAEKALLKHYVPPGVLVDSEYAILRFYGRTWPYIEPAAGAASLNLFHNAHRDIIVELRAAVHVAVSSGKNVRRDDVSLTMDGVEERVAINVICLDGPTRGEGYLLLMFEALPAKDEIEKQPIQSLPASEDSLDLVRLRNAELERDITDTRSYMQAIVEEQEGTNEELRSANEEIQSTNEELQSTNEELETAKEELQSTNEELATVNEELENRSQEVDQANNDLLNLLASVNIPILIVDSDLHIRQFTEPARHLLNLIDADIGRNIGAIRSAVEVPELSRRVTQVIEGMVEQSLELQDDQGRWFSVRLRPYRTVDKRIEGAVLAYIDVTEVKAVKQTKKALENERRLAMIVRDSNDAIILHDFDGNIESWNPAAERLFGYTEAEVIGSNALTMFREIDRHRVRFAHAALKEGRDVEPLVVTRICKDGSEMIVRVVMSTLLGNEGKPIGLVTTEQPTASVDT